MTTIEPSVQNIFHDRTCLVGLRSGGVVRIERLIQFDWHVDVSAVTPDDIAWGLAGENRFNNQLPRPVTVAEHSVLGTNLLPADDPKLRLQFLLHDAAEGLGLGDMSGPLKRLLPAGVRQIEAAVLAAVLHKYGLPTVLDWRVEEVDRLMGVIELTQLHPARQALYTAGYKHHPVHEADPGVITVRRLIDKHAYDMKGAADLWLKRWYELRYEIDLGPKLDGVVESALRVIGPAGTQEQGFVAALATRHSSVPEALFRASVNRLVASGVVVRSGTLLTVVGDKS